MINFNSTQSAGTLIDILTFAPSKTYQSIVFSSSELKSGGTYTVYLGGSLSGTENDSLYEGGSYSPGSQYTSCMISSMVTTVGNTMNMGPGRGMRGM